jgi:hypothetical protein
MHIGGGPELDDWNREMAAYVKSIDPGTYVALGTQRARWASVADADIYTGEYGHCEVIPEYYEDVLLRFRKLYLCEEFHGEVRLWDKGFERTVAVARRQVFPWAFWEYGYWFDPDDIWHANEEGASGRLDGVFWGAKVVPGARKMWNTVWDWSPIGKKWKVHEMVDALCGQPDAECVRNEPLCFIDTFDAAPLDEEYRWFDEGDPDTFLLTSESDDEDWPGYLKIHAGLGQDLWGGIPAKRGAPLLLRPAPEGDYVVESFVTAQPPYASEGSQPLNTQIGLFVFEDVDNWVFFGLTNHDFVEGGSTVQGDGLIVTETKDGVSQVIREEALAEDYAFLRIEKGFHALHGPVLFFSWKLQHPEPWNHLTAIQYDPGPHEVGMGVKTFDVELHRYGPADAYFDFFAVLCNGPPVCDPDGPYVAECAGNTTSITLDGTGSSDPDAGDTLTYSWTTDCPGGSFDDASSATPTLTVDTSLDCVVLCEVSLTVDDGEEADTSSSTVTIEDTTPPSLTAPADITAECMSPAGTAVALGTPTVSDICDASPGVADDAPALFPLGTTSVAWSATDKCGKGITATQDVTVVDTTPPEVAVSVTPEILWPPNHKLVPVSVVVSVSDVCDENPVCQIVSISSNEPVDGQGDGHTAPDWELPGDLTVNLRAERSRKGSGRVYTLTVECSDASGKSSAEAVTVSVPHDKGKKKGKKK